MKDRLMMSPSADFGSPKSYRDGGRDRGVVIALELHCDAMDHR